MTPVDLIDYTDSDEKIPSSVLEQAPAEKVEVNSWKILSAYFLDFMAITTITVMTCAFLKFSFNTFMVTSNLQHAFEKIPFSTFTINFLPAFFMSYFFFSYFFNHGQTWGMSVMRNRIEMKELNVRSSLVWAMFSSSIMMTGGLSFLLSYKWMQKKGWGDFQHHDHLYFDLMQERLSSPLNLVELTSVSAKAQETVTEEENYNKAA
jgi:hypothetical protein